MKISELIIALQSYMEINDDLDVCISGYEGGVTEHFTIKTPFVFCDVNCIPWLGEHDFNEPILESGGHWMNPKMIHRVPSGRKQILLIERKMTNENHQRN